MRGMFVLGFLLFLIPSLTGQEKSGDISIKEVKYDGLKEVILKNRGKVVYLDFWYNT